MAAVTHKNCAKAPCQLCQRRERRETCGSCTAGILIGVNGDEIQRCDECALFESDDDAIAAVQELGKLLHASYVRGGDDAFTPPEDRTVADALDDIVRFATSHESSDGHTIPGPPGPHCGCQSCRCEVWDATT